MERIVEKIKKNPQILIRLIHNADEICAPCPFREGKRCTRTPQAQVEIVKRDRKVLSLLGIYPPFVASALVLYFWIGRKIGLHKLKSICQGCVWEPLGYCREGMKRLLEGKFFLSPVRLDFKK